MCALLEHANDVGRPMRLAVPGRVDSIEDHGRFGRIYTLAARQAPCFDSRYRLLLPDRYLPPATSQLCRLLAAEQPDLLEICDKYALPYLAALLRRNWMPTVPRPTLVGHSCERMDDSVAAYLSGSRLARRLSRAYLRHIHGPPFDAHLANPWYTADELHQALWDRQPGFIRVSPMGVSFASFGPVHRDRALRQRLLQDIGGDARSVLLLYAGRISPEKNLALLIEMMEHLSRPSGDPEAADYRLALVGDGPLVGKLSSIADRRVPGRIRFFGPVVDRKALPADLRQRRCVRASQPARAVRHRPARSHGLTGARRSAVGRRCAHLREPRECLARRARRAIVR